MLNKTGDNTDSTIDANRMKPVVQDTWKAALCKVGETHYRNQCRKQWCKKTATDFQYIFCAAFTKYFWYHVWCQIMTGNKLVSALNKNVGKQCWNIIGLRNCSWSVLERPRSMQAIDLNSQRWDVIGSRSPVGKPCANVPQPMNQSMTDGISAGSLHVRQQYNHLSAHQQTTQLPLLALVRDDNDDNNNNNINQQ